MIRILMLLVSLLWLAMLNQVHGKQTIMGCLGHTLDIKCFVFQVVKIEDAVYGRTNIMFACENNTKTNKLCFSRRKLTSLKQMCDWKNTCRVPVTKEFFGEPCEYKGGEYLTLTYSCPFQSITTSSDTRVVILPNLMGAFARTVSNTAGRQYLTKIQLNYSTPLLFPLTFSIGSVVRLKSSSLNSKEMQYKSLLDLTSDKAVQLKLGDGTCSTGVSGDVTLASFFCIYSRAGYVYVSHNGVTRSKTLIDSYRMQVFAKDHRTNASPSNTSLTVHVSSLCYPVDHFYQKLRRNCPSHKMIYTFKSDDVKWPTSSLKMVVNGGVILGKILVNTNLTAPIFPGNCTVVIATQNKKYTQMFEYYLTKESVKEKRSLFYPRVSGKKFTITFTQEIYIDTQQTLSISVYVANGGVVDFYGQTSILVYGTTKLDACPDKVCMNHFKSWRNGYELLTKAAILHCVGDEAMYYARLSFCTALPYIPQKNTSYFGQKTIFTCSGLRTKEVQRIFWYKNDKVMTEKTEKTLEISGLDFTQQGYYYCKVIYSSEELKSNVVLLKFEDAVKTTLFFDISKKKYNDMVSLDRKLNVDVQLKTKVSDMLSRDESTLTIVTMPTIRESTSIWLQVQIIAFSQLRSNETFIQYYEYLNVLYDFNQFQPFQVREKSMKIVDRDFCLPETTGDYSSYGTFRWNYTASNLTEIVHCTFGSNKATRQCKGNFTAGAKWLLPDVAECEFGSPTTKELNSLLKNLSSSSSSKEETSFQVKQLTNNATTTFTADDTILVKDIVTKIVKSSTQISKEVAENLIDVTDNLLSVNESSLSIAQYQNSALKSILQDVERIAAKLNEKNNSSLVQIMSNHIAMASFNPHNFIGGTMSINTQISKMSGKLFSYNPVQNGRQEDAAVHINLPLSLLTDAEVSRSNFSLAFVLYAKDTLFPIIQRGVEGIRINKRKEIVGGKVFSLSVNGQHAVNLTDDVTYTMETPTETIYDLQCVYWDYEANDKLGDWSTNGCRKLYSKKNLTKCSCNHLTHFAVLFDLDVKSVKTLSKEHELALTILTYIGCGLSLIGIFLTLFTLLIFKFLRRNTPSKVLIGMCISLGLLMISFLVFVKRTEPRWSCIVGSASLQYFVLSSFGWMLVEAVMLYLKVVKVVGEYPSKFILKSSLIALGVPAVIVGVCMGVNFEDYDNENYCVVGGDSLKYGLFLPTCCIILFNSIVFIMVVISLRKNNKESQKFSQSPDLTTQLRIAASCCTLLGLTWLFGVLSMSDARLPFQYAFCIFNSLQGAFIFYFNVLRQVRVKEAWIQYLSGHGRTYEPSTTSSNLRKTTQKSTATEQSTPTMQLSYRYLGEENGALDNGSPKSELSFSSYMER